MKILRNSSASVSVRYFNNVPAGTIIPAGTVVKSVGRGNGDGIITNPSPGPLVL